MSVAGGYGAPNGLTGGGDGYLDKIDGTNLVAGSMAFACDGTNRYEYTLKEDGAAEDPPHVISPDTNAGNKRWHLLRTVLVGKTTTEMAAITGEANSVLIDTDKKTLVVQDGATAGGIPLAKETHSHAIADVTSLQTTLDGKAAASHTHAIADVTSLQTTLDGKAAASHTHTVSQITDYVASDSALTESYDSGGQTITGGAGTLTLTHGLGAAPKIMQAYLTCQATASGYSAGDVLLIPLGHEGEEDGYGFTVRANATYIYVVFGSNSNPIGILNKNTGAGELQNNSNWTIGFRAWA